MSLFRRKKKANDEIFIASFNRSNATVTDSELTEVFSEVGSRYGYADVKAKFKALKDFKVQWQRSYKWAEFTVSDYMDRAPYDVLENLADVLFSKISGSDARYGEAFIRYVTDGRIVRDNRNDYLKRSKGLSKTSIGDFHNLDDCVNRLRDESLIPDDLECELKWDRSLSNKVAGCSVLQRVVTVNDSLDQKGSGTRPGLLRVQHDVLRHHRLRPAGRRRVRASETGIQTSDGVRCDCMAERPRDVPLRSHVRKEGQEHARRQGRACPGERDRQKISRDR